MWDRVECGGDSIWTAFMVGGNALLYQGMVSYHEAQGETKQSPIWERRGTWL